MIPPGSTEADAGVPVALPRRSGVWQHAVAMLTDYVPADLGQRDLREAYLGALDDDTAVFKAGPPVHLTASCIVLDERGEQVMLTMHSKARAWLQFGGHIEPTDESLHAAAVREVREESGIETITVAPDIVELHRHSLGARFGRCDAHLDVRFVGWAAAKSEPVCSEESLEVRWWPVGDLPPQTYAELGVLIERARRLRA